MGKCREMGADRDGEIADMTAIGWCVPGSAPTRPGQTREIEADERAPF